MLLVLFVCFVLGLSSRLYHEYPTSIPKFKVRRDAYTNKTVQTGRVHLLKSKVKLAEFKRHMQCVDTDPNFDYNAGSVSLIKSIPLSREIAIMASVYAAKHCQWLDCQQEIRKFNENTTFGNRGSFDSLEMYRVIDGEVYYDWPWKLKPDRYDKSDIGNVRLLKIVLSAISDVPNVVFFFGGEQAGSPNAFPFPVFSNAPAMGSSDMPWPWMEMWSTSQHFYYHLVDHGLDITNETVYQRTIHGYRQWSDRVPKAALFAGVDETKIILLDAARLHPDLFDYGARYMRCIRPYHPLSTEQCVNETEVQRLNSLNLTHLPAGYVAPYHNMTPTFYTPGAYKYIIVPHGLHGTSTSGRLGILLSTSGAVILMPRMPHVYHFSAQLKPWVHYVPLSYSGTDVVEKVQWLKDHDDMARQIAENGRAFARSYLRLEDYYCYAANAMELLGELEAGSNVTMPFNPIKTKGVRERDTLKLIIENVSEGIQPKKSKGGGGGHRSESNSTKSH